MKKRLVQLTGRFPATLLADIHHDARSHHTSVSALVSDQLADLSVFDVFMGLRRRLSAPTPPIEPDKRTTMSVPIAVMDKLDFLSERTGLARDNLVRLTIENYLANDYERRSDDQAHD